MTSQTKSADLARTTEMLSGAAMVIRALADEGVEYLYGYPGGAVLHIYDALFQQNKVKHVLVRHEQAATHMAMGFVAGNPLQQNGFRARHQRVIGIHRKTRHTGFTAWGGILEIDKTVLGKVGIERHAQ